MKRTLGIIIIYLLQIALLVLFLVPELRSFVTTNMSFLNNVWGGYKSILDWFGNLIGISGLNNVSSRIFNMVSIIVLNIIFTLLYNLIILIIVKISSSRRKKKLLNNNLKSYSLSEEEKAKFNYKLYEKKFSVKGLFSYVIPILLIFFITVIRFDKTICQTDAYREGYFTIYSNSIRPFLNSIHHGISEVLEAILYNYIVFMNQIIDIVKIEFIEYLFIVFFSILLFVLWTVIVLIFVRANRTHAAKKRARKARERYIVKMEKYELSSREKVEDRISSKAREILGDEVQDITLQEDASSISMVNEQYVGVDATTIKRQSDYIDDISTGVVDLGVAGTGDEESEPIERKIPIFVGDEEVDITLDREPFVEIEEEEFVDDIDDDEMPFFEKYSPELTDYSYIDESLIQNQVEVLDEKEEEKEEIYATVKDYEEVNKDYSEEEVLLEENDSRNAIEPFEEKEEIIIVEEEKIEVELKQVVKEVKKKKIKPIDIKKRSNSERFKNAKQKYLVINNDKDDKALLTKKRNLIRRKYKK